MTDENNVNKTEPKKSDDLASEFDLTDLYPTRRGEKPQFGWLEKYAAADKYMKSNNARCQLNVFNNVKKSPIVHVLIRAIQNSGCDFDVGRHISCEICKPEIAGGFDPEYNQVLICQNVANTEGLVQAVLVHEMIHMFDYCRHHMSNKNLRHVACTEIRAANLAHCSFLSSVMKGTSSPWNIQKTHQECVKKTALSSVMAGRRISEEEAMKIINEVFPACYNDLEPIGRRIRRNSDDYRKAYLESPFYGY